ACCSGLRCDAIPGSLRGNCWNRGGSPRSAECQRRTSRIRRMPAESRSYVAEDGSSSTFTRPSVAQSGGGSSNATAKRARWRRATIPLGASSPGSRRGSTRTIDPTPICCAPSSPPPGLAYVTRERPARPASSTASTSVSANPRRTRSTNGNCAKRSFSAARSLSSSAPRRSRCCSRSTPFSYTRRTGGAHGHHRKTRHQRARRARCDDALPRGGEGDAGQENRIGRRARGREGGRDRHRARPGRAGPGGGRQRSDAHRLGDAALPANAIDDPVKAGPAALVVVAVKLWDTESAARAVASVPDAAVVSFQNGVDKDDVLAGAVGPARVLGGVTHIGAVIAEP